MTTFLAFFPLLKASRYTRTVLCSKTKYTIDSKRVGILSRWKYHAICRTENAPSTSNMLSGFYLLSKKYFWKYPSQIVPERSNAIRPQKPFRVDDRSSV